MILKIEQSENCNIGVFSAFISVFLKNRTFNRYKGILIVNAFPGIDVYDSPSFEVHGCLYVLSSVSYRACGVEAVSAFEACIDEEVVFFGTEVPELGKANTLYVNKRKRNISVWDENTSSYIIVGEAADLVTNEDIDKLF